MRHLILSSILTLALFSGCDAENGGCCESMGAKTAPKNFDAKSVDPINELSYEVKSPTPIARPADPLKTLADPNATFPPTAVITPDAQTLKAGVPTRFSCAKSYDNDEQGEKIVSCEWTFECHKKDGYTCNCPKKGNMDIDVMITPHPDAEYMIAHLTVTDNEGETNTTTLRYDMTQ